MTFKFGMNILCHTGFMFPDLHIAQPQGVIWVVHGAEINVVTLPT